MILKEILMSNSQRPRSGVSGTAMKKSLTHGRFCSTQVAGLLEAELHNLIFSPVGAMSHIASQNSYTPQAGRARQKSAW